MALVVNIEGIDGSGKGTQAGRLQDRLQQSGEKVSLLSFPRYDETLFGKAVGEFLNGRFGALDQAHPLLVSLLYAGDRFESREMLLDAIDNNDVVVLDRYVPSNMAHQGAKLSGAEQIELIDWISKLEFGIYQLPRPDMVILLELPPAQAQELVARKQPRTYTTSQADIQEADAEYLAKVREVYLQLAADDETWHVVNEVSPDGLRSVDEVAEEIWQLVQAARR